MFYIFYIILLAQNELRPSKILIDLLRTGVTLLARMGNL